MTQPGAAVDLEGLGWSAFFGDQVEPAEADFLPVRIASVHRTRIGAIARVGHVELVLPPALSTGGYAVGDWVLADPLTWLLHRRLERATLLQRRAGDGSLQLSGANIDTLFIVTSCNADFNVARLERYLAHADQSGVEPVIVLTKADTQADPQQFKAAAAALQRNLPVVVVDPRQPEAADALKPWCGYGRTVALSGSSGVGKSTLVNTLAGADRATSQLTGDIREHDAKGRHTTTARSLHPIAGGGWVMDAPGIRTLHINEMAEGLATVFAEITELAPKCRFNNCTHTHEPKCAVQAAVAAGEIDPERLARWLKLTDENLVAIAVSEGAGRKSRK